MRIHFPQLLNAVTMIFPVMAWLKHRRKMKKHALHKLMRLHLPVSMAYHTCCAFYAPMKLCNILLQTDILFIHLSSFLGSLGILRKLNNRRLFVMMTSTILPHCHAFFKNMTRDQSVYRFMLFVLNALPIYKHKKKECSKLCVHGFACFFLYYYDQKLVIGHATFHMMLYSIYNNYFNMLI